MKRKKLDTAPSHVRKYLSILVASWFLIVLFSLIWNLQTLEREIFNQAKSIARGAFNKDVAYRAWNAGHGGVYVPVTPENQPNPYLKVPNREIITISGEVFTKVNPAFMNRQVNEQGHPESDLLIGHLTSLKPIRPANLADQWETDALLAIEDGASDQGSVITVDEKMFYRFMFPLMVEKACLRCHEQQGYKIGDVRGGISFTIPTPWVADVNSGRKTALLAWHGIFLMLGTFGILWGGRSFSQSVLQRMKVEESLEQSRERFAFLYGDAPLGYQNLDAKGNIVEVNDTWLELTGYSKDDVENTWFGDLLTPESREYFIRDFEVAESSATVRDAEYTILKKDGTRLAASFWRKVELNPDGNLRLIHFIFADLSEQRRLEGQLLQYQKMEAVGKLAGGIAHDFNNILSVIHGYVDMMLHNLTADSPHLEGVEEIGKAATRATNLTRQLLAFSRKEVIEPRVLDINSVVEDVKAMLLRLVGEDIELRLNLGEVVPQIEADKGQLQQVLINLVVNAADSIRSKEKPDLKEITIATSEQLIDEFYSSANPDVRKGSYILIRVSDSGQGIEKSVLDNIFEPFFTTKDIGQGTGLGLATVHGIVTQNLGFIRVYSEEGLGSTFNIFWPRSEKTDQIPTLSIDEVKDVAGEETILLVEDDRDVMKVGHMILAACGFRILMAANGADALEVAENWRGNIDLLLTDVIMPGMNGKELSDKIVDLYPDIKVIFVSGYPSEFITRSGIVNPGINFINKPFTVAGLRSMVRTVLDRS